MTCARWAARLAGVAGIVLWPAGTGCGGAKDPAGTDVDGAPVDTATTEPPETGIDTGLPPPPPDLFIPFYAEIVAYFGYDPDTDTAHSYLTSDGDVVSPQIGMVLFDSGFVFSGDFAEDACGVSIVALSGASFPSEAWAWTSGATDHHHVGFTLPPGGFTLVDRPDEASGMRGCGTFTFDEAVFPGGFVDAVLNTPWGFGFGTIDADQAALVVGNSDYADLDQSLADGTLVGGSILTRADPPWDGRYFALGLPIDASSQIPADATPLTADQMVPASGLPASGAYSVFRQTWIRTTGLFAP